MYYNFPAYCVASTTQKEFLQFRKNEGKGLREEKKWRPRKGIRRQWSNFAVSIIAYLH